VESAPAVPPYRFREGDLSIEATDRADDGVLDAFFAAYDTAFVLANEKEEIGGFRDCLALNAGARHEALQARYGPFRELLLVARDDDDGTIVGGANFIVIAQAAQAAHGIGFTVNLNYLFVTPPRRGRRRSRQLLSACRRLAGIVAAAWQPQPAARCLVFLEINDPFRLTPEQYRLDSQHAGIDQVARLAYWARMGATVLDWPYVQPALSAQQADDTTLALAVLDAGRAQLPAAVVLWHLERFFAISVLKGAALASSASAQAQVQRLQRDAAAQRELNLLELAHAGANLRAQLQRTRDRPATLTAALRGGTP
jgi:GNAT superfamily N-acetyltransferase